MVVGVNVWDQHKAAGDFLNEFGVAYPNGVDESGFGGDAAAVAYGVTGLPETFVVDGQGQLVAHWIGPLTRPALDEMVNP
jgi:cytochrome c biogenesis protein CcmG/thiol:disulfide interchange protein DsbE